MSETVALPTGTVTFLLTDIEGSTPAWERDPAGMVRAMERHEQLVAGALGRHNGLRPRDQGEGDSVFAAFERAGDALACALELQLAFAAEPWPSLEPVRVRMALHTGEADSVSRGNYQGVAVIRGARVRGLARGGNVVMSRATRDIVCERLPDGCELVDLGLHVLKGLARPEHVFALVHAGLAPPDRIANAEPTAGNLPAVMTSLVGRGPETAAVVARLRDGERLLTLLGPGGVGKTRVALAAAVEAVADFPGGVWLVDLSAVDDPTLVEHEVAATLGVNTGGVEATIDAVANRIGDAATLILLDNCEHLSEASAAVASALLALSPKVAFVVTSQVPLRSPGEAVMPIDVLGAADATALFAQRARAASPSFTDSGDDVTRLCAELDYLPLAIELAASRVRSMSVPEIIERLGDRLRLLASTNTGPERHRGLRAALDWSHSMLNTGEVRIFRRLSVFAGGFDLVGAESVAADDEVDAFDIVEILSSLVDRSLVRREATDGVSRFRMLDSVKAYAVERLAGADADEADRCRHRHLDWVVQVLLTGNLRGSDGSLWLERFEREHDNIRAALRWALEAGLVEDAATILDRASRMWGSRGYIAEGELWGNEVLAAANGHPAAESSARLALGWLAMQRADVESSRGHLEVAIERARNAGDRRTLARALATLGVLSWNFERSADAVVPSNEAREIYEELGDPYGVADAVYSVGLMTWQGKGDLEAGVALLEESVRRFRELGDRYSVAECGTCVGAAAVRRGDIATGRAAFAQCARDFEEFGDYPGTVMSLGAAGGCAAWMGDLTDARDKLTESVALAERTGQPILAAFGRVVLAGISDAPPRTRAVALAAVLADVDVTPMPFASRHALAVIVGEIAAALNRWEIAVPVLAAMADLCAKTPTVPPMLPPTADAALARARNALSNDDYAELWAAGPALEWEEIFSFPAAMSS